MTKFFEDLTEGDTERTRGRTITKAEIIDFAFEVDPQPFHIDEEAAAESMFGELVASGLHTLCISTRLAIDDVLSNVANMGGRGLDEIRFYQPVFPGDTLSVRVTVNSKTPSEKYDDRGDVRFKRTTLNQNDEEVMSMYSLNIVRCRNT